MKTKIIEETSVRNDDMFVMLETFLERLHVLIICTMSVNYLSKIFPRPFTVVAFRTVDVVASSIVDVVASNMHPELVNGRVS